MERLVRQTMDRAVDEGTVAGAVMLAQQHGKDVCYAESGMRSIERGEAMTRDTIFRLYSQTKPITGVAAMILAERGIIDLGEPVSAYLPGFRDQRVTREFLSGGKGEKNAAIANDIPTEAEGTGVRIAEDGTDTVPVEREMTIKDLLTMTSGLPYADSSFEAGRLAGAAYDELHDRLYTDHPMGTVEFANRLGALPLRFQPGSRWMYGTSADVMGAVIEVASGMRFGDFLRTEIFEPLGMKDTGFHTPADQLHRLAAVVDNPNNPLDPTNRGGALHEIRTDRLGVLYDGTEDPAFQAGGAGLRSTVDDYARFARMLLNGGELDGVRILQPATVRTMTSGSLFARHYPDYEGWLPGCDYNTFMRIVREPGKALTLSNPGEYGWDGWLGTFFCNDPTTDSTFLLMYQLTNAGTTPFTRKVKNIVSMHLA